MLLFLLFCIFWISWIKAFIISSHLKKIGRNFQIFFLSPLFSSVVIPITCVSNNLKLFLISVKIFLRPFFCISCQIVFWMFICLGVSDERGREKWGREWSWEDRIQEKQMEKESETKRKRQIRISIYWFTPVISIITWTRQGRSQGPETLSEPLPWGAGRQCLDHYLLPPGSRSVE